jgi:hypothetical protein
MGLRSALDFTVSTGNHGLAAEGASVAARVVLYRDFLASGTAERRGPVWFASVLSRGSAATANALPVPFTIDQVRIFSLASHPHPLMRNATERSSSAGFFTFSSASGPASAAGPLVSQAAAALITSSPRSGANHQHGPLAAYPRESRQAQRGKEEETCSCRRQRGRGG